MLNIWIRFLRFYSIGRSCKRRKQLPTQPRTARWSASVIFHWFNRVKLFHWLDVIYDRRVEIILFMESGKCARACVFVWVNGDRSFVHALRPRISGSPTLTDMCQILISLLIMRIWSYMGWNGVFFRKCCTANGYYARYEVAHEYNEMQCCAHFSIPWYRKRRNCRMRQHLICLHFNSIRCAHNVSSGNVME